MRKKRLLFNEFRTRLNGDYCIYCGNPTESDEHWPPISVSHFGFILPACLECNMLAGDNDEEYFFDRATSVKKFISAKYFNYIKIPNWSEEELEELGINIKEELIRCLRVKKNVKKRLAWNVETYIVSIDRNNVFVPHLAELGISTPPRRLNLSGSNGSKRILTKVHRTDGEKWFKAQAKRKREEELESAWNKNELKKEENRKVQEAMEKRDMRFIRRLIRENNLKLHK